MNLEESKTKKPYIMIPIILIGLILIGVSIFMKINRDKETKNYVITNAYFKYVDKEYDSNNYHLIYEYVVDGEVYTYETNYSTSIVPKEGSKKEIYYNPNNPEIAYLKGISGDNVLVFVMGIMFTLIPLSIFLNSAFSLLIALFIFSSSMLIFMFDSTREMSLLELFLNQGLGLITMLILFGVSSYSLIYFIKEKMKAKTTIPNIMPETTGEYK